MRARRRAALGPYPRWYRVTRALALALLVAALAGGPALAGQREVEERLACQCGCGLTVHTCNHLQCSFAVPVRQDIAKSLAAGQSEDDIIARYVAEYGEKVLSSPTMQGFNWLAWITPFAALFVAATVLVVVVRARLPRQAVAVPAGGVPPGADDADARARLERELADLERET